MSQNDYVLIWSLIEKQCGLSKKGVEPSSCLVNSLRNKVCRELLLKQVFVLKWIMMLCKRHCSGIKPAVNYLRYTVHGLAAVRALHGDIINIWAVKLDGLRTLVTTLLVEILTASYGFHMAALALPDIQWCSPVTVSGNTPVLNVLKPVTETSLTDALRNPVDGVVVADQIIFYCCHLDEPGLTCIVDQRCVTSPAVRIIMLEFRCVKKFALFVKVCEDHRVRFLNKYTGVWCFFGHVTLSVYELYKRKIIITANTAVILTKCRCDMNDTSTIAHGNVAVAGYEVSFFVLFCCCLSCTCKKRLVFFTLEVCSFVFLKNLICRLVILCKLAENFVQKRLCHVVCVAVCSFYLAVDLIRVYTKCNVGWKCPRCCCPCQEVCILTDNLETNDCGTLFNSFVSLGNFLCGKRSSTTRAVRNDLETFVKKAFVPDFFQCPPLGLDEVVVVCYIRMLHVSPETNGRGEILPHSFVFPYALFTLLDKWLNSVLLDLFLAVKTKFLLNLKLNRKSVSIPSCFSRNHVSLHCTVSRDHILDNSCQNVSDVWLTISGRRSVIECVCLALFTAVHTLFKNLIVFPEFLNFFFAVNKIQIRVNFTIHNFYLLCLITGCCLIYKMQRFISSQILVRASVSFGHL